MTAIVIDKKKYVLVPEKEYRTLQKKTLKTKSEKLLSVAQARAYSKKLIRNGQQKNNQKESCYQQYCCYGLVY
ncbi:MAG: hypothetical protein SGI83_12260 [Bacteroidota bacterium]|nr:hypothetical protein [Bacteroidota bacterium]